MIEIDRTGAGAELDRGCCQCARRRRRGARRRADVERAVRAGVIGDQEHAIGGNRAAIGDRQLASALVTDRKKQLIGPGRSRAVDGDAAG
jgi:hypothetical protein